MGEPVTQAAFNFGTRIAVKAFEKRKGHGGGKVVYMQMGESDLANFCEVAFAEGAKWQVAQSAALMDEVRSFVKAAIERNIAAGGMPVDDETFDAMARALLTKIGGAQ